MAAPAQLLDDPWSRIGAACGKSRADVAVAYVGQGASRLLPLRSGSKIVVDASEAAVRSGQTDPKELLKYFRKGVEVFSQPRLHAKVFAFSNVAFVGSTNVSNHSADQLVEAAVALGSAPAVAQARRFVRGLAKSPLGEEFIKKLVKIYRPPRVPGRTRRGKRSDSTQQETIAAATPLRLVQLVRVPWDGSEMAADEAGREVAQKRKTRGFKLESFSYARWPHRDLDEEIVQVLKENDGEVVLYPPGRVLAVRKVRNKKSYIVVLELPPKHTRKLSAIRKRLPRDTFKRLKHGGRVDAKHAARLRELWA
jgi:hypothetical protein